LLLTSPDGSASSSALPDARSGAALAIPEQPADIVAPPKANPLRSMALIGALLPRPCAVAAFGTELVRAICSEFSALDCFGMALSDPASEYEYPPTVRYVLRVDDVSGYRRAAAFLAANAVDVVSLQYEHSVFGADPELKLLELLRGLPMPIVTTLHAVSTNPGARQKQLISEIIALSERVVVMSLQAATSLRAQYQLSENKIDTIPYGVIAPQDGRRDKRKLGFGGRVVLFTCGAFRSDNGMDALIDALPEIAQAIPNVLLIVLGEPDIHTKALPGESQRLVLEGRVHRLRMSGHVVFFDRFVGQYELPELMSVADVYVSPFREPESSGPATLAYALACGKVTVSTPDPHAQELLAEQRGVLLPSGDARVIARAVITLCMDDVGRQAIASRAASYGATMFWPEVSRRYVDAFTRASQEFACRVNGP
jgi:glycosyltransferase involved in cell wall biosynthesis